MEKNKKILVVGSGGRCHAIVDAFACSEKVGKIFCAPGNAGISEEAECVNISSDDIQALVEFAEANNIDLTVVGPENPLCNGIVDEFRSRGLKIFGPTRAAAKIEGSKKFAKEIMESAGVPTAAYKAFSDYDEALAYVKSRPLPAVIKYDGLAAGKGVTVATTYEKADKALRHLLLDGEFGSAQVVIEDYLEGPEFSFMCLVNGEKVYPLAVAQDHKRAYDGDLGPNTGGMGAYSPVPFITDEIRNRALREIMEPVAAEMEKKGIPFTGVLYGGLILTAEGPKVIEFNARFGDPETEVVLPRLKSDIYDFMTAVLDKEDFKPEWTDEYCLGIVLAANGYPGKYEKNLPLRIGKSQVKEDNRIYHMGTKRDGDNIVSSGGRVLMVVGSGHTPYEARENTLKDLLPLASDHYFYRKDIGKEAVILDGKTLAAEIKNEISEKVKALAEEGFRRPGLAIILVGDDKASVSYVNHKINDAKQIGFEATLIHLPEQTSQEDLLKEIDRLNNDEKTDGLLVQLPLPSHIDEMAVISAISPAKDVDGFHPDNVSALWEGRKGIVPCTPRGIISILKRNGIRIEGKNAAVVGRGKMVGLPVAKMLLDNNATVTITHTFTEDLAYITRKADILIVAAGHHSLIKGDMIKEGAVIVDVGINRNPTTGELVGDVVFTECTPKASAITPVPGGVGPLTRASLMENTFDAYLENIRPNS